MLLARRRGAVEQRIDGRGKLAPGGDRRAALAMAEAQVAQGHAVLLTTHDLGAAYEICDRITVMYGGQEVETAPVASFFGAPTHPYTAKLLASLPSASGGMVGIPGDVPNFYAPPPGCRFAPRCERASAACAVRPAPVVRAEGHRVRCVRPLSDAVLSDANPYNAALEPAR